MTTTSISALLTTVLLVSGWSNLSAKPKDKHPGTYKLATVSVVASNVIAINDKEVILAERQLEPGASPVPFLLKKNGKISKTVQCPGTVNDTQGEDLNNEGLIVGHCGHDAKAPGLFAFVAKPSVGVLKTLAFPGAISTWGYAISDDGVVVGFYGNQPPPGPVSAITWLHSFIYDPELDQFEQIDHPLASVTGGWTWLHGINNQGVALGHYNTVRNLPFEEYSFLYDHGVFTSIEVPGADQTHALHINNDGKVFGWSSPCTGQSMCPFVYQDGEYDSISLPLPLNEPRPDGLNPGIARLSDIGGLNDKGEFVGTYIRTLTWGLDIFGNIGPTSNEIIHFKAVPAK